VIIGGYRHVGYVYLQTFNATCIIVMEWVKFSAS
jgi:hypothetical protein